MRPRLLDFILKADNFLLQHKALLALLFRSLVCLDELLFDLSELLRNLDQVIFSLLSVEQSLLHISIGMSQLVNLLAELALLVSKSFYLVGLERICKFFFLCLHHMLGFLVLAHLDLNLGLMVLHLLEKLRV